MFRDNATTSTATFCKAINGTTKDEEFLKHANFDPKADQAKMDSLQKQIDEKKKLDISKVKSKLIMDCQYLEAFEATLQRVVEMFTVVKMNEVNQLIKDILEKKKIVEGLSVKSFDDGIFNTIGSNEWKKLISTARTLYEAGKLGCGDKEQKKFMFVH